MGLSVIIFCFLEQKNENDTKYLIQQFHEQYKNKK